jgi:glutamate 5-kinase
MASKVEAARRATLAGANVVVADARGESTLDDVLAGKDVGTLFVADKDRLSARRHWIAFTLRPRGDIILDGGAAIAVREKGRSVLPVGVLGVRGDFSAGDAVRLLDPTGADLGRGLVRCGASDAARVAGKSAAKDLRDREPALAQIVELLRLGLEQRLGARQPLSPRVEPLTPELDRARDAAALAVREIVQRQR